MTVLSHIYASYRHLMGCLPDPAFLCQGGQILSVNTVALQALRVKAEGDLLGRSFADLTGGDYRPVFEDGLADVAEEGAIPMLLLRQDGSPMECEVRVTALEPDSDLYFIHARDLTDRMKTIRDVMASEQRYRALVDLALDAMVVITQGRITMVNASAVQVLRLPSAEAMVGLPVERIIHPDYHALLDLGLDALSEEPGLLPLKLLTADGDGLDAEARVVALPGTRTHVLEARDISARVRAAEGVREREARLKGILNTVADAIVTIDESGMVQSFNRAAERMFGLPAEQAIGSALSRFLPEPDGSGGDTVVLPLPGMELDHMARRADGTRFPAAVTFSPLRLGRQSFQTGVIRDITDRRRAEEAERRYTEDLQRQVEERTRELLRLTHESQGVLNAAGDGILGINAAGTVTFANPAMTALLGWNPGDVIGRSATEVFRHGDGARAGQPVRVRAALRRGVFHDRVEMTLMRRDGTTFIAEYTSNPIPGAPGEDVAGAVVVVRDITERRMVEERLKIAATVFETTAEGILVCGPDGIITVSNPALDRIVGIPARLGSTVDRILFSGSEYSWETLLETLGRAGHAEEEFWAERPDGRRFAARLAASGIRSPGGDIRHVVLVINDITQRKLDEERIRYQATYDSLTGLPNRVLFHDRLGQAVRSMHRSGQPMALMFIDLDGFKAVNDTLGHDAGDILLREAARRLSSSVRESDTVARLGGDEFTVIMGGIDDTSCVCDVAGRILRSLSVPFDLGTHEGRPLTGMVSASIGIALAPEHAGDADTLLRLADAAMYRAKDQGKSRYVVSAGLAVATETGTGAGVSHT